jgi:uncharacterized membrane protein YesL
MQKLLKVGNLAALNVLWLICCLPIFTIGAATTAMHSVIYKYILDTDDAVIQPFFKAFKQNFKQATALWLPVLVVIILLGVDAVFLYTSAIGWEPLLWIPFAVVFMAFLILMTYAFPLIARYESDLRSLVKNCYLLFVLELRRSIFVLSLNLLPWIIFFVWPDIYMMMLPMCLLFSGSAISYWNDRVLLKIFEKRQAKQEE